MADGGSGRVGEEFQGAAGGFGGRFGESYEAAARSGQSLEELPTSPRRSGRFPAERPRATGGSGHGFWESGKLAGR